MQNARFNRLIGKQVSKCFLRVTIFLTIPKQINSRLVICWFFFEVENFEFIISDHNNNTLRNGKRFEGKLLNI